VQDIISAALDYDGAKVVLDHARSIIRGHPALSEAIEVQANGLLVPATGSRWTVTSRDHTASRGRHPTVVIYDEVGWAKDDELFSSLLAGQASVEDPLCLVISTVGRRQSGPLWTIKMLAEGATEHAA
jgi:phage terminase large subunit-like protein